MKVFAKLTKVDEEKRLVYGRAVDETPDRSGEVFDYESSVPYFKSWSEEVSKASDGASVGNLRAMHGKVAAGKLTDIQFNDSDKAIDVVAKVVDDNEWKKVLEGVYTGFSIGGAYVGKPKVEKAADGTEVKRYTAKPSELSLVDRPCVPSANFFQVQKADGTTVDVEFQKIDPTEEGPGEEEEDGGTAPDNEDLTKTEEAAPVDDKEYQVAGTADDVQKLAKLMDDNKLEVAAVVKMVEVGLAEIQTAEQAAAVLKAEEAGELRKGMYAVSRLSDMLQSMQYLTDSVTSEEKNEQDYTSVLPGKMASLLRAMGDALKAMVVEEVAEMLGERNANDVKPEVLALADKVGGLEKVGARNAKSDQERIQKILELAIELGATPPATEKVDEGDLAKLDMAALDDRLAKALEPLQKTIEDQANKIAKLEAQPAQPRGVLKVVDKSQDTIDGGRKEPEVIPVMKNGEVDDAATAIKKLHQSGGQPLAFVAGRPNV